MKRKIVCFLALCLVISMLVGCASDEPGAANTNVETNENDVSQTTDVSSKDTSDAVDEEKPESISVIVSNDLRPTIEYAAKLYTEQHGIEVEIISQAYDSTHDKIMASVMGGSADDVVYIDNPWCAEFATNGLIVPLDEYVSADLIDSLVSFDHLRYDGKIWGLPSLNEGKWLFYNTAMLEEAGYTEPPATWQELAEMSQKMVDEGIAKYGITWAGTQAEGLVCDITHLLGTFGASWLDENGDFCFNTPEGVAALQFYCDTLNNGVANPASITLNDGEAINTFIAGDTPFAICWSFLWSTANSPEESQIAGDVAGGLIPADENANVVSSSCSGSSGYGVLNNSDAKEWAYRFVELLVSEDVQKEQLRMIASLPVRKALYQDAELIEEFPFLEVSYPQLEHMGYRPTLPKYSEWSQEMQLWLHRAVTGEISAEEALNGAAEMSAEFAPSANR